MYEYLDLLERKLDDRQKQVCCRTENTVVAAGAGSGKTQVLATRFAWLVMSKDVPASKILTLTFTKKAAGEMYERIYNTLAFFAENAKDYPVERERAQKALDSFGETHIQTLDSYCARLVRQAANRYGIRPDFTAGSADTERAIKDAALPFILAHRDHPAVRAFADAGKLQFFAEHVLADTVHRYTSIADGDTFFSDKLSVQKEKVAADVAWFVSGSGTPPRELEDAMCLPDCAAALQDALDAATKTTGYTERCKKIGTCIQSLADSADSTDTLERLVNSLPAAGWTKELRAVIKVIKEQSLPYLSALSAYVRQEEDIRALFALFDKFHRQIKRTKRISGDLSFRDIQKMALVILQEQADIRAQENAAYDHIMIDEFQDNNGENRALLFLLCAPPETGARPAVTDIAREKLFFVGDEKQSIYKFRGADVAVFNELQSDFLRTFGEKSVLPMEYNYRSTNALITSFNRLFGGADGIFDRTCTEPYEAQYTTDTQKYDPTAKTVLPPEVLTPQNTAVHVCAFNKKHLTENEKINPQDRVDLLGEKDQLACFIAQKIAALREAGASYGDIAILDKSRTDRGVIISWLNALGIPYRVDQQANLFASGLVFDIYTFLRLCVYPNDRNAYAAYLTSPFAALSENAVETVLAVQMQTAHTNETESAPLTDLPDSQMDDLKTALGDEWTRFAQAVAFFAEQRGNVLSQPLTQTLQTLWDATGYRYETLLNTRAALSAEQFDLLYELARQCDAGGKSVAWFVDQLALLKNAEESSFDADDAELDVQDITYPVEKGDAVHILTIHKSKGLQYKHVFVYGCMGARSKSEKSAVFFDETYGVSVRPEKGSDNYFVLLQRELAKKKERAEFRRLLYVAITRAEQDVYLVGSLAKPSQHSTDDGKITLKLLEKQIDRYYPAWQDEDDGLNYALGETVYTDGAPFNFYAIVPIDRETRARIREKTKELPPAEARAAIIAHGKAAYVAATPVTTERETVLRTTPSALEKADGATVLPAPKADPYAARINPIVEKYAATADDSTSPADPDSAQPTEYDGALQNAAFSYADFGTLAHAYLEAHAHGIAPQNFAPASKLFKNLSEAEIKTVQDACAQMTAAFAHSPQGTALQNAREKNRLVKAEYTFRTVLENDMLVTGSIDLLFENADSTALFPAYTIVDYKSDQTIRPEMYYAQQACYRTAAARLLGCEESAIRCYLYYLRYDMTVDITEHTNSTCQTTTHLLY